MINRRTVSRTIPDGRVDHTRNQDKYMIVSRRTDDGVRRRDWDSAQERMRSAILRVSMPGEVYDSDR